jgi:hypothetical protein
LASRIEKEIMTKPQNLIEWDYLGTHYSIYIKHFTDDDGKRGMTMIFEDVTNDKVTEMVIPSRKFPEFIKAVNGGSSDAYRGLF